MVPIAPPIDAAERVETLKSHYREAFGSPSDKPFFLVTVPLRICPLGAHSDHQGGVVTGLTIDRSLQLLGQAHDEAQVSMRSVNFNEERNVSFNDIPPKIPGDWGNYLRGVVRTFRDIAPLLTRGFKGVIHGAMPIGGLSSSAAVTIAYAKALEHINRLSLSSLETIMLVRAVENGYLGLHNGILDQSVIVSSQKDALTCIDCATHQITNLPQAPDPEPWEIMVVYSGFSRQLTATPFNQRVSECREAARELMRLSGREAPENPGLSEAGAGSFAEHGDHLPEVLRKRARHFFTEAERVREGMKLWQRGEMRAFGRLVTASGESSIVNFESGSPALIALYEILAKTEGVLGTRFCGGGFQGCCLALIDPARREAIAEELHRGYMARHPEVADEYSIHFCRSTNSVSVEVLA